MRVQLYGNTGYNSVDIPDSPDTLAQFFTPILEAPNVNLIQNDYISYLTLNITHKKARIIDYVIIIDDEGLKACYTVEAYEEVAKDIVKFKLLIDPYNTIGGLGLNSGNLVVAGSANRLTVSIEEDNAKFFTLPEPFKPAEEFNIEFNDLDKPDPHEHTKVYIETITIPPRIIKRKIIPDQTPSPVQIDTHKITMFAMNYPVAYAGSISGENILTDEVNTPAGKISKIEYNQLQQPELRKLESTELKLYKLDGTYKSIELHVRWWNKDNGLCDYSIPVNEKTVKGDLIKDFRNNGRDADIVNCWEIPSFYQNNLNTQHGDYYSKKYNPEAEEDGGGTGGYGGVVRIANAIYNKILSITTNQYGNNKTKYKNSYQIKIFNPVNAAEINKELYEIISPASTPAQNSYNIDYVITADIRPQGAPIFAFKYINKKSQLSTPIETLKGGTWRNIPLTATGISNQNLLDYQINNEAKRSKLGSIGQVALGIGSIVGGIALGAGSAAGTAATAGAAAPLGALGATAAGGLLAGGIGLIKSGVGGFIGSSARQQQQQEELAVEGVSAAASITVGSSEYAREIGLNYFFACITRYSDADMVAYDSFLTKYGYNVGNKPISNADFWSRPAFNYIKINDITIQSQSASLEMLEKVKQQLKAGVRIWHKAPNVQDMASGGNK